MCGLNEKVVRGGDLQSLAYASSVVVARIQFAWKRKIGGQAELRDSRPEGTQQVNGERAEYVERLIRDAKEQVHTVPPLHARLARLAERYADGVDVHADLLELARVSAYRVWMYVASAAQDDWGDFWRRAAQDESLSRVDSGFVRVLDQLRLPIDRATDEVALQFVNRWASVSSTLQYFPEATKVRLVLRIAQEDRTLLETTDSLSSVVQLSLSIWKECRDALEQIQARHLVLADLDASSLLSALSDLEKESDGLRSLLVEVRPALEAASRGVPLE